MDDKRFDTWTRRRFGLEAGVGGALAGLFALACGADAEGKKNRKKRRRRKRGLKLNAPCTTGATGRRKCRRGLHCDSPATGLMSTFCCSRGNVACDEGFDCCIGFTCDEGRCERFEM